MQLPANEAEGGAVGTDARRRCERDDPVGWSQRGMIEKAKLRRTRNSHPHFPILLWGSCHPYLAKTISLKGMGTRIWDELLGQAGQPANNWLHLCCLCLHVSCSSSGLGCGALAPCISVANSTHFGDRKARPTTRVLHEHLYLLFKKKNFERTPLLKEYDKIPVPRSGPANAKNTS